MVYSEGTDRQLIVNGTVGISALHDHDELEIGKFDFSSLKLAQIVIVRYFESTIIVNSTTGISALYDPANFRIVISYAEEIIKEVIEKHVRQNTN